MCAFPEANLRDVFLVFQILKPDWKSGIKNTVMSKEEIRKKIDEVDEKIVSFLVRRMELALEIGRLKKSAHEPVRDPAREAALLEKIAGMTVPPLNGADIKEIFKSIISVSRRLQSNKIDEEK